MGWFLLEYDLVDDYLERRAPLRAEHLALVEAARDRGELVLAGALAEPADRAVLVWQVPDQQAVRAFVDADPYVREGLVSRHTIRTWTVVSERP